MSDFYGSIDLNLYEIISKISDSGQYGIVFKAKNASNIYAMKIFKKEIDDTTPRDELKNFIREISNISRTNHPAIVKFIGFSPINLQDEFKPVIITEYLIYNLTKLINIERSCELTDNKLDETQKHKIIYGIAHAMAYLHEHDIIHRDLKPDNILLTDKMEPKICDFGFSKCIEQRKTNISNSEIVFKGTPLYSAPEVFFKNKYSKSGDVYAFGMLVYELYSIEPPFKNCTFEELCINIANGVKPEFDISFPEEYKSLIINCLDYDPLKRPTFNKIVDDLKNRPDFLQV